MTNDKVKLIKYAYALAVFTIVYNIIEGAAAIYFGLEDETLTLFGFGADSFIETISAIGILHMITRIRSNPESSRDKFEITALKITGWCFYGLILILTVSLANNIYTGAEPESTTAGIIISVISICTMYFLIWSKKKIGRELNSQPIISDANCNLVCVYMSFVLLVSGGLFELTGFKYFDALGTIGIIYFSFREGREAFAKANGIHACSCEDEALTGKY